MQVASIDSPLSLPVLGAKASPEAAVTARPFKPWVPKRVLFTPSAYAQPFGRAMHERLSRLGLPITLLPTDRITTSRGKDDRETYRIAKSTLAVVNAPPGQLKLSPIPPSADWQFHLAQGCPAHCQYCYLAGSLAGPPVVRAYANLPDILNNLVNYEGLTNGKAGSSITPSSDDGCSTFEVSCYTDPLGLDHLTGGLTRCIEHFGTRPNARLRWVSKFADVDPLLQLEHNRHTRCRASVNAEPVARQFEAGVPPVAARLTALRKLADAGYPIGLVIAPIMPIPDWKSHYGQLLDATEQSLAGVADLDLTFELITHRFTPGSKNILLNWYPKTKLDLDESTRSAKRNKFGGTKYVYPSRHDGRVETLVRARAGSPLSARPTALLDVKNSQRLTIFGLQNRQRCRAFRRRRNNTAAIGNTSPTLVGSGTGTRLRNPRISPLGKAAVSSSKYIRPSSSPKNTAFSASLTVPPLVAINAGVYPDASVRSTVPS